MFSQGQLMFAAFFVIAFILLMFWSYRKDTKLHQIHYKNGAFKAGLVCVIVIFVFVVLRILIH
jgi:hypothetical protein